MAVANSENGGGLDGSSHCVDMVRYGHRGEVVDDDFGAGIYGVGNEVKGLEFDYDAEEVEGEENYSGNDNHNNNKYHNYNGKFCAASVELYPLLSKAHLSPRHSNLQGAPPPNQHHS